jgi:enoyl-CoA hydratase
VRDLDAVTIAAVNGPAVGAGLAVALACDLRYAADDARLGVPFTSLGMHPGMASTWLLPEVAGLPVARELLLTGRMVTGAEAVPLGLVNRALPAGDVLDEALSVASAVAATAPVASRLTKRALASGGHATFEAALEWEALAQPVTLASQDLQEGLRAQRERRPPRFTGA